MTLSDKQQHVAKEEKKLQSWAKMQRKKLIAIGDDPCNRCFLSAKRVRFQMVYLAKRSALQKLRLRMDTERLPTDRSVVQTRAESG
jgi:hypothetical protein